MAKLTLAQEVPCTLALGPDRPEHNGRRVELRQPRVDLKEPSMKNLVSRFVKDESGATAIEYGLIAAGISVAIITVVKNVGTNLSGTFGSVQNALK
jgi:pilus assembly protein Flp/PilA